MSDIPPVFGDNCDWFEYEPFPIPDAWSEGKQLDPWFQRFLGGKSADEARELLRQDWQALPHPALREFADSLLKRFPAGIFYSKYPCWNHNAWIVISPESTYNKHLTQVIKSGQRFHSMWLLPNPYLGPLPRPIAPDELIMLFFIWFGGLRQARPFESGNFYDFPIGLIDIYLNEGDIRGTTWEDAQALFVDPTGDQLLIDSDGRIGWARHETLTVEPTDRTFEDVLHNMATQYNVA